MIRLKEALTTVSWTAVKQTTSRKGRAKALRIQRLSNEANDNSESPSQGKLKMQKSVLPLTICFDDLDGHDCAPGDVMGLARKSTLSRKPTLAHVEKTEFGMDTSSTEVVLFVSSARSKPTFGTSFSLSKDDDEDDENVSF